VDPVIARPRLFNSATLWLAVFAYSIQIYTDFAGYSSMAIGSARCMGFDIPPNFAAPYSARNITIFWRRWHISLSRWLRDYLYIPLGGNRKGKTRQAINLMIVMLVAGLWHGASWNFVFWGGLHGVALVTHKVWTDRITPRLHLPRVPSLVVSWGVTFGFVTLAWVFFRIPDFAKAVGVLGRMFGAGTTAGVAWYATSALLLVPVVLLSNLLYVRLGDRLPVLKLASFKGAFVVGAAVIGLALFWPTVSTPFIYFQF
jgi:alginate O-acetyltransferase complex protein AlgI